MFKTVKNRVWAFDAEWIPDPVAGRLLYDLPDEAPDVDVLRHMWREGGAIRDCSRYSSIRAETGTLGFAKEL